MKGMSANALESWALNQVSILKGEQMFDITSLIQTLIVEEDMQKGLISGSVAFIDTMNLLETIGMTGDERLYISFNSFTSDLTEKDPYTKIFQIKKYSEYSEPNLKTKTAVQFEFCTPAEIYNELCTVSKSYVNTSNSQIVKEMLEILKVDANITIEDTLFMKDLVVPNITPLEVVSWMGQYSLSKENGDSNFYFYEDRDSINFVSGQTIAKKEPFEIVVEGTNPTDLKMHKKASNYQRVKGYDMLEQYQSGASGLKMMMRDGLRKGYTEETVTFNKVKEEFPVLNTNSAVVVPEDVETARQVYISTEQMYQYNNKSSYGNMYANKLINKMSMTTKRSFLETPGDSDMTVGMIIDLKILNQIGRSSVRDSGKWLVNKCRHIINVNDGRYRQELDLVSDSNILGDANVSGS